MLSTSLLVGSLCALSTTLARGQTVLFHDDFESGLSNWTAQTDWHLADASSPCLSTSWAPFPSGTHCAWMGNETSCNFVPTPEDFRELTLAVPISIPATATSAHLSFRSTSEGENNAWDQRNVAITSPTLNAHVLQEFSHGWHERTVELSRWIGSTVTVSFEFWSGDAAKNDGIGWLVDDVEIRIDDVDPSSVYCGSSDLHIPCPCGNDGAEGHGCANSFDPSGAQLTASGASSIGADGLSLTVTGVSNSVVTFFQGGTSYPVQRVFHGDGVLCALTPIRRIGSIPASANTATYPRPGDAPISSRGAPSAWTQYAYQVRYRNSADFCTAATYNTSNAIALTWRP